MSKLSETRHKQRAASKKTQAVELDNKAKAARVLGSQGKPQTVLAALTDDQVKSLAACCDKGGAVNPGSNPAKVVDEVLTAFKRSQKKRVAKGGGQQAANGDP